MVCSLFHRASTFVFESRVVFVSGIAEFSSLAKMSLTCVSCGLMFSEIGMMKDHYRTVRFMLLEFIFLIRIGLASS